MILEHSYTVNDDDLITEKDISRSRGKGKISTYYYITNISFMIPILLRKNLNYIQFQFEASTF